MMSPLLEWNDLLIYCSAFIIGSVAVIPNVRFSTAPSSQFSGLPISVDQSSGKLIVSSLLDREKVRTVLVSCYFLHSYRYPGVYYTHTCRCPRVQVINIIVPAGLCGVLSPR